MFESGNPPNMEVIMILGTFGTALFGVLVAFPLDFLAGYMYGCVKTSRLPHGGGGRVSATIVRLVTKKEVGH